MIGKLKSRLQRGERAIGCWLDLADPQVAEIVAQAGYDCVMIDLEHGSGDYLHAVRQMQAVAASGCIPMMRVPENRTVEIKRALDAGAQGIMAPAVNSAEEAQAVVSACRYPPEGARGVAVSIVRASNYGADWKDYAKTANADILVICQIESAAAVKNARAIAGVPGVDLLFVGPFDLSANMGFLGQPDHPKVRAAIAKVEKSARAAGKLLGGIQTPERSAEELFAAGYGLVLADADVSLLRDAARRSVASLRKASRSKAGNTRRK